jgi:hypothetical protein
VKLRTPFAVVVLLTLVYTIAWARKPEDVFGGKILISDRAFPTSAKSPDAFVDALRKQSREVLQEDKENKQWQVFYAAFFKQPVTELEISIRVYDVTNGAKRLVDTFEQYPSSQQGGIRAYVSNVALKRGDGSSGYDPNTKILMVMETKGRLLAQAQFVIQGEAKKYKGTVDFSEEETK